MKKAIAESQHIDGDRVLRELHQEVNDLERKASALKQEVDGLLARREGVLRSIEIVEANSIASRESKCPNTAVTNAVPKVVSYTPLSGLAVVFDGAKGHRERVLRIAQAAGVGAVLNTSEVTRFLVESVCADFTVDNLRPTIHRVFDEQPKVYEKESPGNWTLIQRCEEVRYDNEDEIQD